MWVALTVVEVVSLMADVNETKGRWNPIRTDLYTFLGFVDQV